MSTNTNMRPPTPIPSSPALLNYQSTKSPPKVPLNFKSSDYVSKLLAATPSYLYNIPLVPQNFYFSEMLKSFVQARNHQSHIAGAKLLDQAGLIGNGGSKKGRKRLWQDTPPNNTTITNNNNNYLIPNHNCLGKDVKKVEPLELTKNSMAGNQTHNAPGSHAFKKLTKKNKDFLQYKQNVENMKQDVQNQNFEPGYNMMPPPLPAAPAGTQVLGSNLGLNQVVPGYSTGLGDVAAINKFSPFWNYWNSQQNSFPNQLQDVGIDPLHFFIDLRVSGHIYDKKHCPEAAANTNEPLNLQKQSFSFNGDIDEKREPDDSNTNTADCFNKIEPGDEKVIKKENEHGNADEKPKDETETNDNTNMKRNSAFDVPNNESDDVEDENMNRKMLKSNVKNKTKTNYGINYILNNLPKIYKNFDEEKKDFNESTSIENSVCHAGSKNISKDFKYLKSYHNNLRCNKNVYTFQNNYEHFTKFNNATGRNKMTNQSNKELEEENETKKDPNDKDTDKVDCADEVGAFHALLNSSDDEDLYRDPRNDFVDVENSGSDIDDSINSDNELAQRQE